MESKVEIRKSPIHGLGVFAKTNIKKGDVIAKSHVVLLHHNEQLPELLATLEFPWNEEYYALCLSDVGSFFNHDKEASAAIDQNKEEQTQTFFATRDIEKGEEVMIYYNDDFEAFVS